MWGFPGGSVIKESSCNAGGVDSIPGSGRSPGGGNGNPLQYSFFFFFFICSGFCHTLKWNSHVFLPGKSHGQWRLEGYSPYGSQELDTTEQLSRHARIYKMRRATETETEEESHMMTEAEIGVLQAVNQETPRIESSLLAWWLGFGAFTAEA